MTICGHERETMRWSLGLALEIDQGKTRVIMHEMRGGWASRNEAWRDIHDPAKLAAIITELVRKCGIKIADGPIRFETVTYRDRARAWHDDEALGIEIKHAGIECNYSMRTLKMSQARTLALALLDAPQATAQDIERMIGNLT